MHINKVDSVSFNAQISRKLENKLFYDAYELGTEAINKFNAQKKNVENWGMDTSLISMLETKTKNGYVKTMGLVNNIIAPLNRTFFEQKRTPLETFLSLKENDIIKAENILGKRV